MTHVKILEALAECERRLRLEGIEPRRLPEGAVFGSLTTDHAALGHCLALCVEAQTWTEERREKAMRWLAWVQGVMWVLLPVDIATLKRMNMPAKEAKP